MKTMNWKRATRDAIAARRLAPIVAALAVSAAMAACGDDESASEPPVEPVEVTMTDHAYDVSGAVRPGGTLVVRNNGDETHMMLMARMHDGVTLDQLLEAFQSDDESAAEPSPTRSVLPVTSSRPGTNWRSPRPTSVPAHTR